VSEAEIEAAGLFGSYPRALGWRRGKPGGAESDPTFRLRDALSEAGRPARSRGSDACAPPRRTSGQVLR
jgi:hypothetical protein